MPGKHSPSLILTTKIIFSNYAMPMKLSSLKDNLKAECVASNKAALWQETEISWGM
jgi:hypothetical protein